jgi:hypothetical protein
MSCSTSFNLSGPTYQISHRDMNCSKAIEFINQVGAKAPDEYITYVEIMRKRGGISQTEETYKRISHKKFRCLLECAVDIVGIYKMPERLRRDKRTNTT